MRVAIASLILNAPAIQALAADPAGAHATVQPLETRYTVQVGAFRDRANAERTIERLRAHSDNTHIIRERSVPDAPYLVVTGNFADRQAAVGHATRIEEAGFATYVRRIETTPTAVAKPERAAEQPTPITSQSEIRRPQARPARLSSADPEVRKRQAHELLERLTCVPPVCNRKPRKP